MRTGSCTLQLALTSEASSVLRHALGLAKRRGHTQVTPLHVAAVMLSSAAAAAGLFRRACLRAHRHNSPHPLQCRALELCFNVALNRLPTLPPSSSATPALSNALVAALKRAQAHQRRGSVEQQQQQNLLSVKVELEQLIISILDDPSVSRVMKEAGFSSTCVKNNLEEDPSSSSLSFNSFVPHHRKDIISATSFCNPLLPSSSSEKEDLRLVVDVLLGKKNGCGSSNIVVVADSVAYSESLVAELMWRTEKGDVPEELKCVQFVKFELPSLSMGLRSRVEVEVKVADLRRKVCSMASGRGVVVVYVGDLKWAVGEEERDGQILSVGNRAVDHVVAEMGRMLSELRSSSNGGTNSCSKVRLLAIANLQTFMRCKKTKPLLESQWRLHAVFVPSCGLALSLHPSSGPGSSRKTTIPENPFLTLEVKPSDQSAGQDKLMCCAECTSNFYKEASMLNSGHKAASPLLFTSSEDEYGASTFPFLLQTHGLNTLQQDALVELRRKWNRLCQSLCRNRHGQNHLYTPLLNHPWLSNSHSNLYPHSNSFSFQDLMPKPSDGSPKFHPKLRSASGSWHERDTQSHWPSEPSLDSLMRSDNPEAVRASLALGSCLLFSDSATSADQKKEATRDRLQLWRQLKKNIPWQSETIGCVVEALLDKKLDTNNGQWLLLQGSDAIGKQRLSRAIAESFCGSADKLVCINTKEKPLMEVVAEALSKDANCVLLIDNVEWEEEDFLKDVSEIFQKGSSQDAMGRVVAPSHPIFIISTGSKSKSGLLADSIQDRVIKMKLHMEEPPTTGTVTTKDLKRKADSNDPFFHDKPRNPRTCGNSLDLNVSVTDPEGGGGVEDEKTVPSDLTQEMDAEELRIPHGFVRLISAPIVMDMCPDRAHRMVDHFRSKLLRSVEEASASRRREETVCLLVDWAVVEELAAAAGSFLESLFDAWLREVFQSSLPTAMKGGKLRLCVEGMEGNAAELGFRGSTLPQRIPVE